MSDGRKPGVAAATFAILAAGFAVGGGVRWRAVRSASAMPPSVAVGGAPDVHLTASAARGDSIDSALDVLEARDPFERWRGSRTVPPPPPAVAPEPARAPRPTLVLRGIVGTAPNWRAVLDGIPGTDGGALLAAGDSIAGLRVRRVTSDSAVVQGADTTWRLGVPKSW